MFASRYGGDGTPSQTGWTESMNGMREMLNNPLQNRRREKFAQLLASGKSAKDAYSGAGYKASDSNGAWLARKEEISSRVAEINSLKWSQERAATAVAVARTAITRQSLVEKLEAIGAAAHAAGQYAAAVAAVKEIAVLLGIRIERSERGAPHEFADVSTADLIAELRELEFEVRDLGVPVDGDVPPSQAVN
jgi:hypothetical protein